MDTVVKDSSVFYRRIQNYSARNKITEFTYRLIFRPLSVEEEGPSEPAPALDLSVFEGKVIRNIEVRTLDPFGFDRCDTMTHARNFFEKAGNFLHVGSLPICIRNRLMIEEDDTFDSLRVKESMRLLRGQNSIREVFLLPVLVPGTDSVDIFLTTLDVWSIIASGSVSKTGFHVNVKEKNFAGLGHQVNDDYSLDHTNGNSHNSTDYYFSNIFNTYINAVLHYDIDQSKNYGISGSIDRPFYSIFTKWAGGIQVQEHLNRVPMLGVDSTQYYQSVRYVEQDHWLGRSWQLFKGKAEQERSTALIVSGRIYDREYHERVPVEADTSAMYRNEIFYLGSAGIYRRKYKQDRYIFRFGNTEDVPVGRAFSIVAGQQEKEGIARWYFGVKTFWASYSNWGYISADLESGSFYKNTFQQSSVTGGITYFTNMGHIGRWKFRQFVKPQFTIGFNREKADLLTINNEAGIRGFNSSLVGGDQKILLSLQTQSYAPWNLIGFRFGPYFVFSAALVGSEASGFRRSPLYSQFGIGVLIKNDFLVMNSFEISVAYFPVIPGSGRDVFKPNPFHTSDLGFRDSGVGKPTVVSYR